MAKTLKIILVIFLVIVFLFSLSEIIQDRPSSIIKCLKVKDTENKIVVLKLKALGIIPVGFAKIQNIGIEKLNGIKVYHLKATAETLNYFSKLFKAKVQADSYVDVKNLYSFKFLQHAQTTGDYDYNREIIYDQRRKVMKIGNTEREIFEGTQDPLSAIFYLRNQKFGIGKEFNININTNQKNYLLTAKVKSFQEIDTSDSKVGIWLLNAEVKRRDKSQRHKTSVKIWFLDDQSKTPIKIRILASGGLIIARLIGLE